MSYRRLYLGLLAATCITALIVTLAAWTPLRAVAGLPLFFGLPGVLTSYAAIPPDPGMDWRLRGVLSLALSISLALLVGLALGLAFDEVSQAAIALALGAIGAVSAAIAVTRVSGDAEYDPPLIPYVSAPMALVTGLLVVACAALSIKALDVDSLPGKFTALTIANQSGIAQLAIENHQGEAFRYRYEIRGDSRLIRSGLVDVADGQTRSLHVVIPPGIERLRGAVYLNGRDPYRSVSLQLKPRTVATASTAP